jgi:hypothetical protein
MGVECPIIHGTTCLGQGRSENIHTLIPRLLVLLKTDAMTGKSSFLIVEKSRTGSMVGKLRNEASTIL